ncbi:Exportin 7 [Perkinsus olseni]|uniref:Exportin 7 n=1 Tax=Perkinsus olseni TaxID=32597 RepID=A0A7J6MQ12_PEROL|nr:Exportin 7 [Perkinsus olseni]
MDAASLAQFERLCTEFYNPPNEQAQRHAHEVLTPLLNGIDSVPQLQYVLANSSNQQALVFASTALTKVATANWTAVTEQQREDMKNFMLNYLFQNCEALQNSAPYAVSFLVRFLCRIVKLSWLEGPQHQTIVSDVQKFLSASTRHWILGLDIYVQLTADIQPTVGPGMSRFRRTALSFRDIALPQIFTTAVDILTQMYEGKLRIDDKMDEFKLVKKVLQLAYNCLSFDFMETALLQSMMEGTAHLISNKVGLSDPQCLHETCRLIGRINTSSQFKELKQVPSFEMWLEQVYGFTIDAIKNWQILPNSKHYLLQFWAQLVMPIMNDKDKTPGFHTKLEDYIYTITVSSGHRAFDNVDLLGKLKIFSFSYIDSRLFLADMAARGEDSMDDEGFEDALQDEVLRGEQLDVIAQLARLNYQKTAQHVLELFGGCTSEANVNEHKLAWLVYIMGALVGGNTGSASSMRAQQQQQPSGSQPLHVINGEIAGRVFSLMNQTDANTNLPPESKDPTNLETLELSYLYFMEQFRKVYIGEHARQLSASAPPSALSRGDVSMASSENPSRVVQERVCTVLGLKDEDAILGILIKKIVTNLQHRYTLEAVLKRTLAYFYELAAGVNIVHSVDKMSPHLIISGKLLLKNDTVRHLMANHASSTLGFLHAGPKYGRYRTQYYATLGKLLFMECRDGSTSTTALETFNTFMMPQYQVLEQLWQAANTGDGSALRSEQLRLPLIGLCRDLRGICQACVSHDMYTILFNWLVDNPKQPQNCKITVFSAALNFYWDDPEVTTPLLKFVAEFVYNKAQRINFDQNSPNGILLFREASKILVAYSQRMLQREQSQPVYEDIYREKYKGIGCVLELFSNALHGNYTNFGVFELYNDNSLSMSLSLALKLCMSIPIADLMSYLKCLKPFFMFLELATRNHAKLVCEVAESAEHLAGLIRALEEGLTSFDSSVCMQCCASIDNLCTFFYDIAHTGVGSSVGGGTAATAEDVARVTQGLLVPGGPVDAELRRVLNLMLQLIMAGEFNSTWSISRPILALILMYKDTYTQAQELIVRQQPTEDRQQYVGKCFSELMVGVTDSLQTKNRDHFTRNMYHFAQAVRSTS